MGLLVEGVWRDQWYDTKETGGRFQRQASRFRNWVTPDGSPGPAGKGGFAAAPGRYHLYVSLACPWAHRTIIFRKLKGLEDAISLSVVSPHMAEEGWTFDRSEGSTGDPVNGAGKLYEVYRAADANYSGRVTVPVLWDKE
ncbi:MAG TPA: glutathione S-transferase family protein, partial [Xanthobacteraceae bacterium]